jgi:hypothetical protein
MGTRFKDISNTSPYVTVTPAHANLLCRCTLAGSMNRELA